MLRCHMMHFLLKSLPFLSQNEHEVPYFYFFQNLNYVLQLTKNTPPPRNRFGQEQKHTALCTMSCPSKKSPTKVHESTDKSESRGITTFLICPLHLYFAFVIELQKTHKTLMA